MRGKSDKVVKELSNKSKTELELDVEALRVNNAELTKTVVQLQRENAGFKRDLFYLQKQNIDYCSNVNTLSNYINTISEEMKVCVPKLTGFIDSCTKVEQMCNLAKNLGAFYEQTRQSNQSPNPIIVLTKCNEENALLHTSGTQNKSQNSSEETSTPKVFVTHRDRRKQDITLKKPNDNNHLQANNSEVSENEEQETTNRTEVSACQSENSRLDTIPEEGENTCSLAFANFSNKKKRRNVASIDYNGSSNFSKNQLSYNELSKTSSKFVESQNDSNMDCSEPSPRTSPKAKSRLVISQNDSNIEYSEFQPSVSMVQFPNESSINNSSLDSLKIPMMSQLGLSPSLKTSTPLKPNRSIFLRSRNNLSVSFRSERFLISPKISKITKRKIKSKSPVAVVVLEKLCLDARQPGKIKHSLKDIANVSPLTSKKKSTKKNTKRESARNSMTDNEKEFSPKRRKGSKNLKSVSTTSIEKTDSSLLANSLSTKRPSRAAKPKSLKEPNLSVKLRRN